MLMLVLSTFLTHRNNSGDLMAAPLGFVSYSISNDKAFEAKLKEAGKVADDLRIPLLLIADDFYKSQKAIFTLRGPGQYPDFKGPKIKNTWKRPGRPELRTRTGNLTAYQYAKQKKHGFVYPLLKATGDLEDSVSGPGAKGSIFRLTKKSMTIGTSIEYGPFHQQDSGRGDKMPMRKFLFIGPEASPVPKKTRGRLDRSLKRLNAFIGGKLGKTFKQRTGQT